MIGTIFEQINFRREVTGFASSVLVIDGRLRRIFWPTPPTVLNSP